MIGVRVPGVESELLYDDATRWERNADGSLSLYRDGGGGPVADIGKNWLAVRRVVEPDAPKPADGSPPLLGY